MIFSYCEPETGRAAGPLAPVAGEVVALISDAGVGANCAPSTAALVG